MPNLVTYCGWTLVCEWYVLWCGSKNGYQKCMYSKEIGLHTQNMTIIQGSIVNIIEGGGMGGLI